MSSIEKIMYLVDSEEDQESFNQSEAFSLEEKLLLKTKIIDLYNDFRTAIGAGEKEFIRSLHINSKKFVSSNRFEKVWKLYQKYSDQFIDGSRLEPSKIQPSLKFVEAGTIWEDLFKIVRHTWSIPYSKGYGRRMRFVVYDEYHKVVIGILGFQSPPADLACRDALFNYPDKEKLSMVNRTMDVYTIGAIPPYSNILGGKLVAGLVASDDVRQAYWRLYAGKKTVMNKVTIEQPLVGVTTTSVYGRSSIYNRLKYKDRLIAEPIGYTKGYGTIHLEQVYPDILKLLRHEQPEFISGGFGTGPKIRWQHYIRAFSLLQLSSHFFEHGLRREVYLFRFTENIERGMSTGNFGQILSLSVSDYSEFWKHRWAIPRAKRTEEWKFFKIKDYMAHALQQTI